MKADRLPSPANVSPFKKVAPQFEGNKSGIQPIGTKVLVMPEQIEEKTAGGILLANETVERNSLAVTTGVVVAIGAGAFSDWANVESDRLPKPGDKVHLARYSGLLVDGDDGKQYRLCQDVDIAGTHISKE